MFCLVGKGRGVVKDRDGNIISDTGWIYNQIKNVGKQEVAKLIGYGLNGTAFRYLAIGSSNAANDPTQTALVNEITTNGGQRGEATISNETTYTTGDTVRFQKTWTATGGGFVVEEVGIFNNSSGGTLLGRLLTGTQTISGGSTFTFTYDIILS